MSLQNKISQRDLDAFRIGIEEQARRAERIEHSRALMERDRAKRYVSRVRLIPGDMLIAEDVLVETFGTTGFREREVVLNTTYRESDNRIWVETTLGGIAIDFKTQLLIEDKG